MEEFSFTVLLRTNTVVAIRNHLAERTGLGKSVSVSLRKNGTQLEIFFELEMGGRLQAKKE